MNVGIQETMLCCNYEPNIITLVLTVKMGTRYPGRKGERRH